MLKTQWCAFAILAALLHLFQPAVAQTLPAGTTLLEETARRQQVTGRSQDERSFMIRPLFANSDGAFDSLLYPALNNKDTQKKAYRPYRWRAGSLAILPVQLKQQFNSHHPYGWNDGAMIPAKGYQVLASAGVHARIGILSLQLQPEVVMAANPSFEQFPESYSDSLWYHYYTVQNRVDAPARFGNKAYRKILPGQSSIRLNVKKLSLGISSESLWWGPGQRNSLLMTNTAPGFPHLTFNTTAPVRTRIGLFEWQVIAGRLKGSGFLPQDTARRFGDSLLYTPKLADHRYINAFVLNWQPRWIKGLYLGFSRSFYQYESQLMKGMNGYFPVLGALLSNSARGEDTSGGRDQLLALSFRYVLPEARAEVYGEYGRNDRSLNLRDVWMEPEHSRAYVLGARKYYTSPKGREGSFFLELTQLQRSNTILFREQESWYTHYQVRHGYTYMGQVIGAGIGPGGSNSQSLGVNWFTGGNKTELMIERIVRNNDFFYAAFAGSRNFMRHWVDYSFNYNRTWSYKNFLFGLESNLVRSLNYQWRQKQTGIEGDKDVFNLRLVFSTTYRF